MRTADLKVNGSPKEVCTLAATEELCEINDAKKLRVIISCRSGETCGLRMHFGGSVEIQAALCSRIN